MNTVAAYFTDLYRSTIAGWNRFWFTPTDPATLSMIRILGGLMLLYTHAVWTLDLEAFFGADSWVTREAANLAVGPGNFTWSYFWLIDSPTLLWAVHIAGLVILAMLVLGLFSRVTSVLSFLVVVAYVHRTPGALFGLDQINAMLALYLMVGSSGACYSLDRLIANRRGGGKPILNTPSVSTNVAIRLIQLHMCVIYLFAGLSKLQGPAWWNGTALWGAFANLEYQSLDMTWLAEYPLIVNFMTHVAIVWEISFIVLVWPRLTRPLVIAVAVPLHLGIAFCMGMITFGLVMLIGCLSFVSPSLVRGFVDTLLRRKRTSPDRQERPPATASAGRRSRRSKRGAAIGTGSRKRS